MGGDGEGTGRKGGGHVQRDGTYEQAKAGEQRQAE
jgi:hypothetical protein